MAHPQSGLSPATQASEERAGLMIRQSTSLSGRRLSLAVRPRRRVMLSGALFPRTLLTGTGLTGARLIGALLTSALLASGLTTSGPLFAAESSSAASAGAGLDAASVIESVPRDRSASLMAQAGNANPASPSSPDDLSRAAGQADALPSASQSIDLPLEELRLLAEAFGRIKATYVEPVTDEQLLEDAIRGMLGGLDPHSAYLDAEDFEQLREGTSGKFGGLGIEVGMEDGLIKVVAPIDDTPAARAGIRTGDLIVRIDGQPVKGLSLSDAVDLMRGEPGSVIELSIVREGEGSPLNFELERAIIQVASVKQRMLAPGFGYLRISNFQSNTTQDLREAIAALREENAGPLKGAVLDLRNNPGGVLDAAVGVSDIFLPKGRVVYTEGRLPDSKLEFSAEPDDLLEGAPLVVLVNGGSASASEIVAGAIQDHQRGLIMGEQTFGKGSVQTIVPIDDQSALKLTTARYYTPSGRSIQAQGIVPDILLPRGELVLEDAEDGIQLSEASLRRHLEEGEDGADGGADDAGVDAGGNKGGEAESRSGASGRTPPAAGEDQSVDERASESSRESTTADQDAATALLVEDFWLAEALNMLRGLSLYRP